MIDSFFSRLVQGPNRQGVRSSTTLVRLIRYVARIVTEEPDPSDGGTPRLFIDFPEAYQRHRANVVK